MHRKLKLTEDGEKRLSCIGAALKVLSESADPMNAQEMITAMEAKAIGLALVVRLRTRLFTVRSFASC